MSLDLGFLRELCLAPAPSGFEAAVQAILRRRLAGLTEPQGDPLGDLWASWGPEDGAQVMAIAHADQIGLIVTHIDENGFLRYDVTGWLDQQLLPGHTLLVHGRRGPVRGVVGRVPTHIVPEAERGKAAPFSEQYLDIGARSRAEALERVAVGDPVTFDQEFAELAPGRIASKAIDDRAGVYAVVRALELYAEAGDGRGGAGAPGARLTMVSSTHEETTCMGARAVARTLRPDVVIVVDGDFTTDYPGVDPAKMAGETKLGAGPILGLGSTTSRLLTDLALEVAADLGMPVQTKAYGGRMLTDSEELSASSGAATLALSIPMRYVHSAAEVADTADIEAAVELVVALTKKLGEVWRPGMFVPGA